MRIPAHQLTDKGKRTRARLLKVAEHELLEHDRIEVTRVAERANASLGLLYRYFADKDDLVTAVVDGFYDRYEKAVFSTPAPHGARWLEHERQRIEREVAFLFDEPLGSCIVGGTPSEPAAAHADARRMVDHIDLAARNIAHGQRRGEISVTVDSRLAAAAIIGSLRACLGTALDKGSQMQREAVVDTVQRVSLALIAPAGPNRECS